MIDEKKIEEVAKKCADNNWLSDDCYLACADGFKAGINWFLNNSWHDASVPMLFDKSILVEYDDKSYIVIKLRGENDRNTIPLKNKITRWLYIDDLQKGGSHEQ